MITIPADAYTGQLDLLLADGTVVYQDGCSRWRADHPDGTETYLGQRRELSPSYGVGDGGYDYQTYTERFTR